VVSTGPLGDYLLALERLHPGDDAARRAIAGLLGFTPPAPEPEPPEWPAPPPPEHGPDDDAEEEEEAPPAPAPTPAEYQPVPEDRVLPSVLSPVARVPADAVPRWVTAAGALPAGSAPPGAPPREPEPLFNPATVRALLSAALSTLVADGPVDVTTLVRSVAAGRVLRALPRRPRRAIRHGVQLLVDRGDGMLPFRADVRQLTGRVRAVAGSTRVSVLGFEGTPLRGTGTGSRRTWTPYERRLPAPGTVVAAITDLGMGELGCRAAPPGEWLATARLLRRNGSVLRAFVPYPAERVPGVLLREIRVIEWDRTTAAGAVHKLFAKEVMAP
jgi:hypothetical protein